MVFWTPSVVADFSPLELATHVFTVANEGADSSNVASNSALISLLTKYFITASTSFFYTLKTTKLDNFSEIAESQHISPLLNTQVKLKKDDVSKYNCENGALEEI